MDNFFRREEIAELRETYKSTRTNLLSVFAAVDLEKMLAISEAEFNKSMDSLEIVFKYAEPAVVSALAEPENKQRVLDLIAQWSNVSKFNMEAFPSFIEYELKLGHPLYTNPEKLLGQLEKASAKTAQFKRFVEFEHKLPFLFAGIQLNNLLTADNSALVSIMSQLDVLERISYEDIAEGNLPYSEMLEVNKLHSPLTPTLLTLLDVSKMEKPEGYSYFPIVNTCLFDRRSWAAKGIVETIPRELFEDIKSLDSRLFAFGKVGVDLKNMLTSYVMTGTHGNKKAFAAAQNFCAELRDADYSRILFGMNKMILLNVANMIQDRELLMKCATGRGIDEKLFGDIIERPSVVVYESLKRNHNSDTLHLTEANLKELAGDFTTTSMMVKFRYIRREQNGAPINDLPKVPSPGVRMYNLSDGGIMVMPLFQLMMLVVESDMTRIIKQGPRKIPNGGKFYHKYRDFYEGFKKDGLRSEAFSHEMLTEVVGGIFEQTNDKEFKKSIDLCMRGQRMTEENIANCLLTPGNLEYISSVMKGFIFTQELDGLESLEETALGYAMGNCLKLTDLMRYSINSNARLFCFWANGKRVGMSYSVGVTQNLLTGRKFEVGKNGEAKEVDVSELSDSLIDSIEIGDQFLKDMHKEYSTEEGKKIHDYLLVHRLVDNYLMSSLQDSRRGIYVLPESNNFLVRRAMGSFIESMGGVRVIEYSGVRVNTDTDFSKVPYWIDKQSLQGKVHTTMKCSDGSTEKDVKLSAEEAAEAYHMSDEAAESFVDLIGRITEFNESD